MRIFRHVPIPLPLLLYQIVFSIKSIVVRSHESLNLLKFMVKSHIQRTQEEQCKAVCLGFFLLDIGEKPLVQILSYI